MTDLQRDIDAMDSLVRQLNGWGLSSEESSAWQRIRQRLTPDRERVAGALKRAYMPRFALEELDLSRWKSWEELADAAIDAMKETP